MTKVNLLLAALKAAYIADGETWTEEDDQLNNEPESVARIELLITALEDQGVIFPGND